MWPHCFGVRGRWHYPGRRASTGLHFVAREFDCLATWRTDPVTNGRGRGDCVPFWRKNFTVSLPFWAIFSGGKGRELGREPLWLPDLDAIRTSTGVYPGLPYPRQT